MYEGPIIDTHHHLWEVKNYPWLLAPETPKIFGNSYEMLRNDYLIDDLLTDFGKNNVVSSVHVQAHYDPSNPVGETEWLQSVADQHGFPHAIAGYADLTDPEVEKLISAHCAFDNFRAIRHVVYWQADHPSRQVVDRPDFCLSKEYRRGVSTLGEYGVSLELQGFSNQFSYFSELIGDNPGVSFCLVHAGLLTDDDEKVFNEWHKALTNLVEHKNIFVKCSGVNLFSKENKLRNQSDISRQYNTLIDLFGSSRCFFGSNFPVEKLKTGYDFLIDTCKKTLEFRPESDQKNFFYNTAKRFYRL